VSRFRPAALLLLLLLALPVAGCGRRQPPVVRPLWPALYEIAADDVPEPGQFIRYAAPDATGGGLDVAVTTYESTEPGRPKVQLVGVVHVADALYYEHLQQVLDRADVVLFEAIKPEGVGMTQWMKDSEPKDGDDLAGFQQELAAWFGFEYQLNAIDYSGARYVHADMTVEKFIEEGGGELLDGLPIEVGKGDPEGLTPEVKGVLSQVRAFGRDVLSEPNPLRSLARRLMAQTLGKLDEADALGMFPGLDDLVIGRRNAVAVETLSSQLDKTQGTIAIFYGAAHNPDLERRIAKLGYRRASAFWLRAWALRPPLR
jgi:hypothetical protein